MNKLKKYVAPLVDPAAWILFALALIPLAIIDWPMTKTLIQWTLYAAALAGAAVIISRIVLPTIKLEDWLIRAVAKDDLPAAIVSAAVIILLSSLFLGMVLWARA